MERLWEECSKEEKAEIEAIEAKQWLLKEQFSKGEITGRKYRYNLTILLKKVDEVEKKYGEYNIRLFD